VNHRLVLFDIDLTLIRTSRSGLWAMNCAGQEIFGPDFTTDGIEFAGRLDTLIIVDALARLRVEPTEALIRRFRRRYALHLQRRLDDPAVDRSTLPGVEPLLARLRDTAGVMLGLVTGNFSETGRIKLAACGLDPGQFLVGAFAEDATGQPPSRDELPPVAIHRCVRRTGRQLTPDQVIVVGDTPWDIRSARRIGVRALGVATGQYSQDELRRAGADLVVPDLRDSDSLVAWMSG
jgi:phosphoglycolate phosphatase